MIITKEERGLVFSGGEFKKLLMPGRHSINPFCTVETFRVENEFKSHKKPLELLLSEQVIKEQLTVTELSDRQVAIHYENGMFRDILKTGIHAFWKGYKTHTFAVIDLDVPRFDAAIPRVLLQKPDFKELAVLFTVESYQKGLLFIDKAFAETLDPGNYYFVRGSKSISVETVDLRRQQLEITGQDLMTKDKIPVRLNFFCQYRIIDLMKAFAGIKEYEKQFYVLLQLALREYIGSLVLDEVLEKKEEIGRFVMDKIRGRADDFGLELLDSGIKDVILPGEIKDIMNQVLVAEKKSQANVIMRREETASTRSLLNTARLMEENGVLYKLKELEYIERISEKISQISLTGGMQLIEQLRRIFIPGSGEIVAGAGTKGKNLDDSKKK